MRFKNLNSLFLFLYFLLFMSAELYAQCPENIAYSRQHQVDSFPSFYPDCKHIPGDLYLGGVSGQLRDISNLDSLAQIESVGKSLTFRLNDWLWNTDGLKNLQSVGRDITILRNEELVDLSFLHNITSISGSLSIEQNDSLQSLSGLESLKTCRRIVIRGNNHPAFNTLFGLSTLDSVGNFSISDNENLLALSGIDRLETVENSFSVSRCPSLNSLDGSENIEVLKSLGLNDLDNLSSLEGAFSSVNELESVWIRNCDALPNLGGLSFKEVSRSLAIEDNKNLSSLSGLSSITHVGDLIINKNTKLSSLNGFNNNLEFLDKGGFNITKFEIRENSSLMNLSGIPKLPEDFGVTLEVVGNENLQSLAALNESKRIGSLVVEDNANLKTLADLVTIENIGSLIVKNNEKLENLPSFVGITAIGNCEISNNPSLLSFQGLDQIVSASNLIINKNASLSNLEGLEALKTISLDLKIDSNEVLHQLSGLESLEMVGREISIRENKILDDCQAICTLLKGSGLPESVFLENNLIACNSIDSILTICPADTVGEVQVFDIIYDGSSGIPGSQPLPLADVKVHLVNDLVFSGPTDSEGKVSFSTKKFEKDNIFTIFIKYPGDELEMNVLANLDDLNNTVIAQYPMNMRRRLLQGIENMELIPVTYDVIGDGNSYEVLTNGYSSSEMIDSLNKRWTKLNNENALRSIEEMQRVVLGLEMLRNYYDQEAIFAGKFPKSLVDGLKAIMELSDLLYSDKGLKGKVQDFLKQQFEQGATGEESLIYNALWVVMNDSAKFLYERMKRYQIDPYINQLDSDPRNKETVQWIRRFQFAFEKFLLEGSNLTMVAKEVVIQQLLNLSSYYLLDQAYIEETKALPEFIIGNAIYNNNSFSDATQKVNEIYQATLTKNNRALEIAENFESNAKDIGNFGAFLEDMGIAIALLSAGTLSPAAGPLSAIGRSFKILSATLTGLNIGTYTTRFVFHPLEAAEAIDNTVLNPIADTNANFTSYFNFPTYNVNYILENEVLIDYLNKLESSLSTGDLYDIAQAYVDLITYKQEMWEPSHKSFIGNLYSYSGAMGQDSVLQEYYQTMVSSLYKTDMALENLNFQFMAMVMDSTDLQIQDHFLEDIGYGINTLDTLTMNLEDYESKVASLPGTAFVNVVNLAYPDIVENNAFDFSLTLKNSGAAESGIFSVKLGSNENTSLSDSIFENIQLAPGEVFEINERIDYESIDQLIGMSLEIEGTSAESSSITFAVTEESSSTSVFNYNAENSEDWFHPNPSRGFLYLSTVSNTGGTISMFNSIGEQVKTFAPNVNRLDIQDLPSGVYYIKIHGKIGFQKIVKL